MKRTGKGTLTFFIALIACLLENQLAFAMVSMAIVLMLASADALRLSPMLLSPRHGSSMAPASIAPASISAAALSRSSPIVAVSSAPVFLSKVRITAKVAVAAGGLLAAILAYVFIEVKKRANLIQTADKCMDGDEGECELYDEKVAATKNWKLQMALPKLPMTNFLAEKLAGPAPKGFEWGKTY